MRGCLLLLVLALAGCNSNASLERKQREQEDEILELKDRVLRLQHQVEDLQVGSPVPAATPITARCRPSKKGDAFEYRRDPLNDLHNLDREVRIVPDFKDGKADGMKLAGIQSDSFLTSCGFQNGDVLLSVNSLKLDEPGTVLQAYQLAETAPELEFALMRSGKPATVTVHLVSP